MADESRTYIAIDLKSFYASVECVERGLDPLTTNLVVADASRTEKTICLAVSPSLKAYGIPGRARLFEVVQTVNQVNAARRRYETYIREHLTNLIKDCLKKLDDHENYALGSPVEIVEFICRMEYFERDVLERAIDLASRTGQTEVLSILMDERHRRFPVRKKKFVL